MRRVCLFLFLLFSVSLVWGQTIVDIAQNGDFENWTEGLPDYWYGPGSNIGEENVIEYTESVYTGSKSCKLINEESDHARFTTDILSIKANTEYTVIFYARGKGEVRAGRRIGNSWSYDDYTVLDTDSWTEISWTFEHSSSSDDVEVIISLRNTNETRDHIQIDSVSITYVDYDGYFVDFEGAGETKGAYASGTVNLSGLDWDMTEALIGTSDSDWKNGERSARLRGHAESSMKMLENKENGIGDISFYYRRYGTDTQVDWMVEYSTDNGVSWTQIGEDFTAPASDDVQQFSEEVNASGDVRIRIKRATEEGDVNRRLNIDDILITDFDDQALPVTLEWFKAEYVGNEAVLSWQTASETNNLGWNLYRADDSDEPEMQLNAMLIEGAGTTSQTTGYSYTDPYNVVPGNTYYYWLESKDLDGSTELFGPASLQVPIEGEVPSLPEKTKLRANFPNPFNPDTYISFDIRAGETGILQIYDLRGRVIEKLEFPEGSHFFHWQPQQQSSGIYIYRLQTESYSETKKMLLLK